MKVCRIEGCDKPAGATGRPLCDMHHSRMRRHRDPAGRPCIVDGCDKAAVGRGLCHAHWTQWKRRGDPLLRTRPPDWTAEEDRKLLDLPRYPRSGMTQRGEIEALSLHLGRSAVACRSRLCKLRKRR